MNLHRQGYLNWILVCVMLFAGCQAYPARAQNGGDPAVPPGLEHAAVRPYTGEQLKNAGMKLEDVLNQIKQPDYLPADPVALQKKLADQPQVEPPIGAMLAYLQACIAWDQKRLFEARQYLERALTLAPDNNHLLQMLAQLWAASDNRMRSSAYLEKAVQVDPLNMELVLQLGGFALDQDRYEAAMANFHYVQQHMADTAEPDMGLMPLVDYYLGAAMDRQGYAAAAITCYRRFLTADIQQAPRNPREGRRMELLFEQQGILWRQMGDTYCQLQQYDNALEAYRTAVTVGVANKIDIVRRLVYVCLKLDRADLAATSALEMVTDNQLDRQAVELIEFVASHVPDRQKWIAQIQAQLKDQKSDTQALMLLVNLFDPQVARQMIREHLANTPEDLQAINWLLEHLKINEIDADLSRALDVILKAMVAKPQQADEFTVMLVAKVTDQARLQKLINALPKDEKTKALRLFLLAQTYAKSSDLKQAQKLLEEAILADDQLTVARLRLAVLHMSLKEFDEADKVLIPVNDPSDPRVVGIRVKLLTQADRLDEALAVLDRALAVRSDDVDLLLQKAQVLIAMHKAPQAERTLLDALNVNPQAEAIYEALFEMYDQGAVPDAMEQYKRLMMRVLNAIPQSRVARMHFADALSASGKNDRAEGMFLDLLKENPQDYRVLNELLDLYRQHQQNDKADKLLEERIAAAPDDRLLMLVAQTHYQQAHQQDKWFMITEQIIRKFDEEPIRTLRLGSLYMGNQREKEGMDMLEGLWKKQDLDAEAGLTLVTLLSRGYSTQKNPEALDKLFEDAIKRYPDHDADLLYTWGNTLERSGRAEQGQAIMLQLLEKHPDHAAANNGLGYTWANKGINLDKALKMIQKAVDSDPNNAAYLDSMGWVHYKLGQFDKAVERLKQAQAAPGGDYPVILDHLGDAQYRSGDVAQAIRTWQRAQQLMTQPDVNPIEDPEIKGLGDRLKAKITATTEEKQPPVADVVAPAQP